MEGSRQQTMDSALARKQFVRIYSGRGRREAVSSRNGACSSSSDHAIRRSTLSYSMTSAATTTTHKLPGAINRKVARSAIRRGI